MIEIQDVLDALNSRNIKNICPFCNSTGWSVNPTRSATIPFQGDSFSVGIGETTPVVQLTCTKCGFVAHFNTMALGIDAK